MFELVQWDQLLNFREVTLSPLRICNEKRLSPRDGKIFVAYGKEIFPFQILGMYTCTGIIYYVEMSAILMALVGCH